MLCVCCKYWCFVMIHCCYITQRALTNPLLNCISTDVTRIIDAPNGMLKSLAFWCMLGVKMAIWELKILFTIWCQNITHKSIHRSIRPTFQKHIVGKGCCWAESYTLNTLYWLCAKESYGNNPNLCNYVNLNQNKCVHLTMYQQIY